MKLITVTLVAIKDIVLSIFILAFLGVFIWGLSKTGRETLFESLTEKK